MRKRELHSSTATHDPTMVVICRGDCVTKVWPGCRYTVDVLPSGGYFNFSVSIPELNFIYASLRLAGTLKRKTCPHFFPGTAVRRCPTAPISPFAGAGRI